MKLNNKVIRVLENKDFAVHKVEKQGDDFIVEINQGTPLGEDWWETIWFDGTDEGFIKAVRERYNYFDVDDETEIWIENRGKNGVPNSIRALIEDAEWKELILGELADELEELELETEKFSIKEIENGAYFIAKDDDIYTFGKEEERTIFYDKTEAENILEYLNETTELCCVLLDENN